MPPNAKRPDAAHIMTLARNLAMAVGTDAYLTAHAALESAVYTALHGVDPAHIVRAALDGTPATLRAERDRAVALVRRANVRLRELHLELCFAEAGLAMATDPSPPGDVHGTDAANASQQQVAA